MPPNVRKEELRCKYCGSRFLTDVTKTSRVDDITVVRERFCTSCRTIVHDFDFMAKSWKELSREQESFVRRS